MMKGKPEVITMLNELLAEGHAAAVNCATYAALCRKWGEYDLKEFFGKRLHEELEIIGKLLARVVYLDGSPQLQNINEVPFVENIEEMLLAAQNSQLSMISMCNDGIELSNANRDYGTKEIVTEILCESEEELAKVEAQITQSMR